MPFWSSLINGIDTGNSLLGSPLELFPSVFTVANMACNSGLEFACQLKPLERELNKALSIYGGDLDPGIQRNRPVQSGVSSGVTGGQCVGIRYRFERFILTGSGMAWDQIGSEWTGPVSSLTVTSYDANGVPSVWTATTASGVLVMPTGGGGVNTGQIRIRRVDGLPDNCGNPPPSGIIAPSAPSAPTKVSLDIDKIMERFFALERYLVEEQIRQADRIVEEIRRCCCDRNESPPDWFSRLLEVLQLVLQIVDLIRSIKGDIIDRIVDLIGGIRIDIERLFDVNIGRLADISIDFDPQFSAVLNAIANIQASLNANTNIDLSAEFSAVLNALAQIDARLNLEASFNGTVEFNGTVDIDFSPVIEIGPSVCEGLEPRIIEVEKPVLVTETEIVYVDKVVEVIVEKPIEPDLETRDLPYVECSEEGSPEQKTLQIEVVRGSLLGSSIDLFAGSAALAVKGCESEADKPHCFSLLPGDAFGEFKVETQLVVTFGLNYPKASGSRWDIHVPNPIDELDWCTHFEGLTWNRGKVFARIFFGGSKVMTGGFFSNQAEAERVLTQIAALSKSEASPVRTTNNTNYKRELEERETRAVRAGVGIVGANGELEGALCYRPPTNGC